MPNDQKVTRKLRAILSADAKGYSLLMADDEIHTIQTLKVYRQIMADIIQQHLGRVVDNPGDNLLAEFSSAVDAVDCAVKIQTRLKKENAKFVAEKRLEFRIGINIGDIIQDGGRIYGEGVNIAARIEGLASAGGVCVSRNAYDHIKKKLSLGYEYMGEHPVKNISEPVRVYKVLMTEEDTGKLIGEKKKTSKLKWILAATAFSIVIFVGVLGGFYWKYFYLPAPTDIDPENKMTFDLPKGPSVAVLPFLNMTGDPKQEALCDGITENLIATLAHVPRLFVIARNSTYTYKGKAIKVQQIGHELGAKYIIEGSIQKSTDNIRITVQLVETNSGNHIWSDIYDRKLENIFGLQDEITFEIMKAMQITLTEGEKIRDQFEGVNDLKLWLKMTKAANLRSHLNPMSNHLARKEAYEIIEINPNLSFAYTILGSTYLMDLWFDTCDSPMICFGKATEAVRTALRIDNLSPDAHLLAAYLYLLRKEYKNAIAEAKRAISLSPNNADAYHCLGLVLNWAERPDKGIEFINKAIRLNPISSSQYLNSLGNSYLLLDDFINAVDVFKQALKLDPDLSFAYSGLVLAYIQLDRDKEAKDAAKELLKIRPDFSVKAFMEIMPIKNQDTSDAASESLRKAGLPD